MSRRLFAAIIFFLTLIMLVLLQKPAKIPSIADIEYTKIRPISPQRIISTRQPKQNLADIYFLQEVNQFAPVQGCVPKPPANPSYTAKLTATPITLERFRKSIPPSQTSNIYNPREVIALAAASNYGDRYVKDVSGKPASRPPIIVLHETVAPADRVINYFQALQTNEDDQASYHTLIALDGTIIYLVPPDKRAFGAGNSVFTSRLGKEAVKTNSRYSSSVNNFAYHISLETPADGIHDGYTHSGYTEAQYQSLGWLVAKTNVSIERITTHREVDRSRSRIDPRSFSFKIFREYLKKFPRTSEIVIGCPLTTPTDIINASILMTKNARK